MSYRYKNESGGQPWLWIVCVGLYSTVLWLTYISDPLPFQLLAKHPDLCKNAVFVDVDYEKLMHTKSQIIRSTSQLKDLLPDLKASSKHESVLTSSPRYVAVGCDLRDLPRLEAAINSEINLDSCEVLFVAEVSLTYMEISAADAVLAWAPGIAKYVRFLLLEQYLPGGRDHPFARTMLNHFEKLQAPLKSIHQYDSLEKQERRFHNYGWPTVRATSLWECWQDQESWQDQASRLPCGSDFTPAERRQLDFVEAFDEWEEFGLFASHYFILKASSFGGQTRNDFDMQIQNQFQKHSKLLDSVSQNVSTWSLICLENSTLKCRRRYGAAVPEKDRVIGHHGGLGPQSRLRSIDLYGLSTESSTNLILPSSGIAARMCHTITSLSDKMCLLVGGRSSPDKAMSDCWFRSESGWTQVTDIPAARYRHAATRVGIPGNSPAVVVFGGKHNTTHVLGDWLLWQPGTGWRTLGCWSKNGELPPPRFSASLVCLEHDQGLLFGGVSEDGRVLRDLWFWKLTRQGESTIIRVEDWSCNLGLGDARSYLRARCVVNRFGAAVCPINGGVIIVGGISTYGVHQLQNEIVEVLLENKLNLPCRIEFRILCGLETLSNRPLLIGNSLSFVDQETIFSLGGGAVCFSFGTHWNEDTWILQKAKTTPETGWALRDVNREEGDNRIPVNHVADVGPIQVAENLPGVARIEIRTALEFDELAKKSQPIILDSLDIGDCTKLWSIEYLRAKIGPDRMVSTFHVIDCSVSQTLQVTVHEAKSQNMNFQNKNFVYAKKKFGDFLEQIEKGEHQYLRSISTEKPTETPANLGHDFPAIAGDFKLPAELVTVASNAHSSPLRMSGPVTMWLHYDVSFDA
jgi:tRNA wybutosine-synthesizing protein 4